MISTLARIRNSRFVCRGPVVTVFSPSPSYCTHTHTSPKHSCLERSAGRRGAVLWVSLSAVTAARGPGEYCRHGPPGRPKNPHAPRTHKTTPTRRLRRAAARPPEHLRDDDDDELLFLSPLSLSHPSLFLSFSPCSSLRFSLYSVRYVCRITAATEYEVAAVSYYVYTVFFGRPPNTRSANKWPHAERRKNTGHETQLKNRRSLVCRFSIGLVVVVVVVLI